MHIDIIFLKARYTKTTRTFIHKNKRKHYTEMDARIAKVESEKAKELRVQRRELEMQNITNMICLVCVERLRCGLQMETVCKYFEVNYGSIYFLS